MAKSVQLKDAIWIFVLAAWSAACYATEKITLAKGLSSIPVEDIGLALLLAAGGGLTGTLIKLARGNHGIKNLWLEIAKDIASSLLAGMFAYLGSDYMDNVEPSGQAIAIMFAGLGGSKLLEIAMDEGIAAWARNFIYRVIGKQQPLPAPTQVKEETPQ